MTFFELASPRQMLDKARREHVRLKERVDIDNVFNFMVTANHIHDYVKQLGSVPKVALDSFVMDSDLRDCRDLCDKGKHVRLTRRADPSTRVMSSHVGAGKVGEMMVGASNTWLLESSGRTVDVESLADRVMRKWEQFFTDHGL